MRLGWLVNLKKSDLVRSQQFTDLGLDFNTVLALVRPSLKCVERHEACIRPFLWQTGQLAHAGLWLLGHMVRVADLTRLDRLHTRPLQSCLLHQWRPHRDLLEAQVPLEQLVLMDLPWWLSWDNTRSVSQCPKSDAHLMWAAPSTLSNWKHYNSESFLGISTRLSRYW